MLEERSNSDVERRCQLHRVVDFCLSLPAGFGREYKDMAPGAPAIIVNVTKEHPGGFGPLRAILGVVSTVSADHGVHL